MLEAHRGVRCEFTGEPLRTLSKRRENFDHYLNEETTFVKKKSLRFLRAPSGSAVIPGLKRLVFKTRL